MHPSARGPRKNASQTAMSNQQTIDIFKLIRTQLQPSQRQIPLTQFHQALGIRVAHIFSSFARHKTSSRRSSGSAQHLPSDCKIVFHHSLWGLEEEYCASLHVLVEQQELTSPNNEPSHLLIKQFHQLHRDPGGLYYLSRHFYNTAKSFNLSCTSHHTGLPLHTSQAKTKLAKNSVGLRLSVRVDFGGHGMAQDPLSTVEHGRAPSIIGGCGIPQGLLNLHRAYRSARSWTVSLLIARPAQPQTMFLDHFSSIESLIGDRGILQDLSKTFEH
ncbi:hypothetical protein D6C78_09771 [Aureobasidium pullulans]|uniref:Uncharacterized protein n=1 Tax=Aureobasidium pullulans TaxID=5580 RepID=A0A4T0B8A0_AURPU|nr:hypothetical protein D6C78_09771 [Aureobasidium pullulans]